jgi:hypothetical protein
MVKKQQPGKRPVAPNHQQPHPRKAKVAADGNDTGLHISMRALLSIIAGLLVADAVKACVVSLTSGAASTETTWANAGVALAGTMFVTRVVTDNLLYYAEPDIRTKDNYYRTRVFLILLDLMSYAACYAIVARITIPSGATVLATGAVRWIVIYATVVELLHAAWAFIARCRLPNADIKDQLTRDEWLSDWLRISATSAVVGIVLSLAAWWVFYPGFEPISPGLAVISLLVGIFSSGWYLVAMQKHYSRMRSI